MTDDEFIRRHPFPVILQGMYPQYTYCGICGVPWNYCEPFSVKYSHNKGTFATCTYCWEHCTLEQVQQAHKEVWENQYKNLRWGEKMEVSLGQMMLNVGSTYLKTH